MVHGSHHPRHVLGVTITTQVVVLVLAGLAVGALVGIGGGVVLVPLLVLGFDIPLQQAVPASLMCVVASSCGAAVSAYSIV